MIALVHMPYAAIEHPSLALGLLQAESRALGLACHAYFPNLDWCRRLGGPIYHAINATMAEDLAGEWTFAAAAFAGCPGWERVAALEDDFLTRVTGHGNLQDRPAARAWLAQARARAGEFVEEWARRLVAAGARVVGCSSTFQQHCASLALLRRIKALDPSVYTVLGGANCEGEMGLASLENFGWVDYVVSGEADGIAAPFFASLLERRPRPVAGVLTREGPQTAARATLGRLDEAAVPDFDDYFRALNESGLDLLPGLLVETSRGCWWGQKHHCTFCGLNGTGMNYRSKSGPRVLDELQDLAARYQLGQFEVVDNILDHSHLKHIMPVLAARPEPYQFFYETKSNLKREQLQSLAAAGVRWIQPGIESLHDEVLKLMDKGSTALMNLQLLQHAREFGIRVIWNFLACFPGEEDCWYSEMAAFLPWIHHLQPAGSMVPIRYDRFSPYFSAPERHGIQIQACGTYRAVYPLDQEQLERLAYFFEDRPESLPRPDRSMETPGRRAVLEALRVWRKAFWQPIPPILSATELDGELLILDTRPQAPQRRYRYGGRQREILLECRTPRRYDRIDSALEELIEARLVLPLHGRYLSLPVWGSLPRLPEPWQFPGGFPGRPEGIPKYRLPQHLESTRA